VRAASRAAAVTDNAEHQAQAVRRWIVSETDVEAMDLTVNLVLAREDDDE